MLPFVFALRYLFKGGGGRVKKCGSHGRPGCPYGFDPAAPSIAQLVNRKCVVKLHIIKLVVLSDIFVRETEITQLRLALLSKKSDRTLTHTIEISFAATHQLQMRFVFAFLCCTVEHLGHRVPVPCAEEG